MGKKKGGALTLRKAGDEVDRVRIKKASKTKRCPTCGHENKIKT